jgi:hypothetical protein
LATSLFESLDNEVNICQIQCRQSL